MYALSIVVDLRVQYRVAITVVVIVASTVETATLMGTATIIMGSVMSKLCCHVRVADATANMRR